MRLTSSFAVFQAEPGEQELAKARWHARDGRLETAEDEYRKVLETNPRIATGWIELFDLLRRQGRLNHALEAAEQAETHFGPEAAMPLALKGAALSEMGRTRDAVKALEAALERDGNLALAWHELAYAAYRVGELPRALLALDRAFALEPHTDTLMLRGRILRESGQYEAATVAFEAARQATDHDIPQREAERELLATNRAGSLGGKRPKQFSARERAFVQSGTVILAPEVVTFDELAASFAGCIAAFGPLARQVGWKPAAVAGALASDQPLAEAVGRTLGVPVTVSAALDPADQPLIVTVFNNGGEDWAKQLARFERWKAGITFALAQTPSAPEVADVAGRLGALNENLVLLATETALQQDLAFTPDVTEAAALAASERAPWRRRISA